MKNEMIEPIAVGPELEKCPAHEEGHGGGSCGPSPWAGARDFGDLARFENGVGAGPQVRPGR